MNTQDLSLLANPHFFTESEIRTALDEAGEVWFCARDVCLALDIYWSGGAKTLQNMPESWQGVVNFTTPGGRQDMIFINESGLFRLIFRSNKPKADEFANWVCGEVLPAIRKTGGYGVTKMSVGERIALSKQIAALESDLLSTRNLHQRELLMGELHSLCNLAGRKMPEIAKLPLKIDQADLFIGETQ